MFQGSLRRKIRRNKCKTKGVNIVASNEPGSALKMGQTRFVGLGKTVKFSFPASVDDAHVY